MVGPVVLEWSREQLRATTLTKLSRNSRFKPMVWLSEDSDGIKRVVKDCGPLPFYSRWLAKIVMWREYRIMLRLAGITEVPQVKEVIDRCAFSMTFIAGQPLSEENFAFAPRRIADDLLMLVEKLHQRKVFHLDLRQRQNILLGDGLKVQIIDFGASWAPSTIARVLLGRLLSNVDRSAALKYLARFAPEQMTVDEAKQLLHSLFLRRIWILSPYRSHGIADTLKRIVAEGPLSDKIDHNM
ncbi:MAG: hypothetical protein H8E25_06895 [Planctomycetes bacterium]|nr:hypothetical protein [Planctomycetota bacterium]